ncbi:MAG: sulfotransferase [Promethearchaeota archaeon]
MPKPIFIVGNQRSGTTWLANILCQHSKIVGVQSKPYGIRESRYFNWIEGLFGDLKNNNNFIHFIETYGTSDYFRLTGISKDLFYQQRPKTYFQVFRLLMDTFANNKKAEYWLEKSPGHTLFLYKISNYFKTAKFIGIKRNAIDTIKSAVRRTAIRNNVVKKLFILRRLIQYYKYDKHLNKFLVHSNRTIILNYEDLRKKPQEVIKKVIIFLGLNFEFTVLKDKYTPNTSFSNFNKEAERATILTPFEIKMIKWFSILFKNLPYRFYRILYFFQLNVKKRTIPPDFWKDYIQEKFQQS